VADEIDAAQAREQMDRELAIAAVLKRQPQGPGAERCRCGEAISELRQRLGAVRCVDCQATNEGLERVRFGR
jgi:hypothetical protein